MSGWALVVLYSYLLLTCLWSCWVEIRSTSTILTPLYVSLSMVIPCVVFTVGIWSGIGFTRRNRFSVIGIAILVPPMLAGLTIGSYAMQAAGAMATTTDRILTFLMVSLYVLPHLLCLAVAVVCRARLT